MWYYYVLALLALPAIPLVILFVGGLVGDILGLPLMIAEKIRKKKK
jgi:hypothetical protein